MNRIAVIVVVSILTLFFYLEAARAEVVDRVVAVVSNDVITLYELDNVVKSYIERMGKSLGSGGTETGSSRRRGRSYSTG